MARQAAVRAAQNLYDSLGHTWIDDAPMIVSITGACENTATLYRLTDSPVRYLSQTAQLTLESELRNCTGVYSIGRSFRAERPDQRHLNEFILIEEEFVAGSTEAHADDCSGIHQQLLERISSVVCAMLRAIAATAGPDEALINGTWIDHALESAAASAGWPQVEYRTALDLLNERDPSRTRVFGDDLVPEDEALLLELAGRHSGGEISPVFVTRFPATIKFFNMKTDPRDTDVVLSADLLLPHAGEAVGAAVREIDVAQLRRRLMESEMLRHLQKKRTHSIADFEAYLAVVASGAIPLHAGYGIGLERVLQAAFHAKDIRSVSGTLRLADALATTPEDVQLASRP
jgi:asparaginyl-tRNA synthetase